MLLRCTFLQLVRIFISPLQREIEFLSKSLGCKPISDGEAAELVKEMSKVGAKVVKITGVKNNGSTVSVLAVGSNSLLVVLDGCARILHDAVCVVRCLVKKWFVNFNRGSQ